MKELVRRMLPCIWYGGAEQVVGDFESLVKEYRFSSLGVDGKRNILNPTHTGIISRGTWLPFWGPGRNLFYLDTLEFHRQTCHIAFEVHVDLTCSPLLLPSWQWHMNRPCWFPLLLPSIAREFSAFKSSCDSIGPTQVIQDNLFILLSID